MKNTFVEGASGKSVSMAEKIAEIIAETLMEGLENDNRSLDDLSDKVLGGYNLPLEVLLNAAKKINDVIGDELSAEEVFRVDEFYAVVEKAALEADKSLEVGLLKGYRENLPNLVGAYDYDEFIEKQRAASVDGRDNDEFVPG